MLRVLGLLAATLIVAPQSSAEIFKCATNDGLPLYQNFPCEFDSPGTLPSRPATANPTARPESTRADARNAPAISTPTSRARPVEPGVGMTADEVKTLWGEPEEVVQDEPRSGRVEIWQYADGRVVQINQKRRVISVQK